MNNIKIVRLQSGEEIICQLNVIGNTYYLVDPCIIIPTGKNNIGIARWMPYTLARRNATQIASKFVLFVVDPVQALADNYIKMTSSIVIPTAGEAATIANTMLSEHDQAKT